MTEVKKAHGMSRSKKWFTGIAVALVIYSLLGFLVIPAVVKSQMLKRLPDLTHRQTVIDAVRFNPYTFTFEIRKFALSETNGSTFSGFDDFKIHFKPLSSIIQRGFVFGEIYLEKPVLQVIRAEDGTFNFANLIPVSTNAVSTNTASTPPKELPQVLVQNLSISNGVVGFQDFNRLTPFKSVMQPIHLNLTNLTTLRGGSAPSQFAALSDSGETFSWMGNVTVNPIASTGHLVVEGIPLAHYSIYSHALGGIDFSNGVFALKLDYQFYSTSNGMKFTAEDITTGLIHLEAQTADGRDGVTLADFKAKTTVSAETFANRNAPLILVTNTWMSLGGLEVKNPSSGEKIFTLPSLLVTNVQFNSDTKTAVVGLVQGDGGNLSVRRNSDGSLNVLSLIPPASNNAPANSSSSAPTNSSPVPAFHASIENIAFDNFSVKAEDLQLRSPATFTLDQIHLHLSGVSMESNATVGVDFGMRYQETGSIQVTGKTTLLPTSADLKLAVSNVDLRSIQPYVAEQARLVITNGTVNLTGHALYEPSQSDVPPIRFTGDLAVNQFATTDDVLFKDLLGWEAFGVSGISVQLSPDVFHVDEIKFKGLHTRISIAKDKQINLLTIAKTPESKSTSTNTPTASESAAKKLPEISLGAFVIEDGAFHFSDKSIEPNCVVDIQEFKTSVTGLSTKSDSTAVLDVGGKIDNRGTFEVSGKINPLSKDIFADIQASVTNLDLTPFTPYTEKFVGRPLNKGKFSTTLQYSIHEKALKAQNGFFIDQLTFGAKNDSPDATTLPVKFAIALLKDREGRIKLDVPVEGRLDDPKFSIGPIIWQVVGNIITKAVTSPFSLLGSMFGGGPEMSYVDFAPGETAIPDSQTNKINSLANALFQRPELTVEINGSVDPGKNRESMARAKLKSLVRAFWLAKNSAAPGSTKGTSQTATNSFDYPAALLDYYQDYSKTHPQDFATSTNLQKVPAPPKIEDQPAVYIKPTFTAGQKWKSQKTKSIKPLPVLTPTQQPAPAPEGMEARLLETIHLTQSDFRKIMALRAGSVHQYLLKTGKVTEDRLFVTTPKPMDEKSKGADKVNLTLD